MNTKSTPVNRVVAVALACSFLTLAAPNALLAGSADANPETIVRGNTEFALDLYANVRDEPGNLFFSPYSISTALAMTYAGARGETESQMADILHFSLGQEKLHSAFEALLSADRQATSGTPGSQLHVANALWGQKNFGFLKPFLDLTQRYYGAGLREVDFAHALEQTRQTINEWVEAQTNEKIKELLRESDLDAMTALVLTNAIYFKGDWATQFDSKVTQDRPFRISQDDDVAVPMMYQLGKFQFAAHNDVSVLELPYEGDHLSMVLLLPKETAGLAALEKSLTTHKLDQWLGSLRESPVRVSLPRFKLDTRVDLKNTLQTMGMTDPFSPAEADFTGMAPQRGLFIGKVIHQAQVDVNEEGTEASAATAVVIKKGAMASFVADHPFLFLIRNNQTGSILFMGRVVNPKA